MNELDVPAFMMLVESVKDGLDGTILTATYVQENFLLMDTTVKNLILGGYIVENGEPLERGTSYKVQAYKLSEKGRDFYLLLKL